MEQAKPGLRVGDYEFLDRLAVGGMGELWRVRHLKLGAVYVAKQLRPEYREDTEFLKRFLHEARLVANLRHPNIVQVFGYDEEHTLYLMEYIQGLDLDHLLRSRRVLEFKDKRCIIEVVADAIGYAHTVVDLIHRDIKPSNVLIEMSSPDDPIQRGRIKLTDFGIARLLSVSQRVTMSSGMVMGTLHYMAPEQFEGNADKPSDVYSIGVLYYQLLTGKIPFDGPTAFVIRDKHLKEIPPAPHEVNPEVPLQDSTIVMKCLEKDPASRYPNAAALYGDLSTSKPTTRTMTLVDGRPVPRPAGAPTAHTEPIEPTIQLPQTEATLPQPSPTARTAPAAAPPTVSTLPAAVQPTTEATLQMAVRPARRRWLRRVVIAAAVLVALPLLATLVMKPKYEVRWNTLRSDPLDTPNGIEVAVCPKFAGRLAWWSVGTVAEDAPAAWSNWTTWFDSIDVKLSDGLFREYVVRCRKGKGVSYVDFGGATFEQLAQARDAKVAEDLSRVGDYIQAVLVPKRIAAAHRLIDVLRCLDRVDGLAKRAGEVPIDKARLETYRGSVSRLMEAARALAEGDADEAESQLREADAYLQRIEPGELKELPQDFLFRQTLGRAAEELKAVAGKANRLVEGLEPITGTATDLQYTLEKYRKAEAAVSEFLTAAPGRQGEGAVMPRLAEGTGDVDAELKRLGDAAPAPIDTMRRYLARLDALLRHEKAGALEAALRAGVLKLLDDAVTAPPQAASTPWLDKCFERDEIAAPEVVQRVWQRVHRPRFDEAVRLCRDVAADRLTQAEELLSRPAELPDGERFFADAEACLEAVREAKHASDDDKSTATALLSALSVKHALYLFCRGPQAVAEGAEHLAAVRKLLDRGLDVLPGCPPDTAEQGRVLRQILKAVGGARGRLEACLQQNFATAGAFTGEERTLFDALSAYERLANDTKAYGDHPCRRAALAPFVQLGSPSCRGFTLPNAAACWLLAGAAQSCKAGRHSEAARLLRGFDILPGGEAGASSPLKRLLAEPLRSKAEALLTVAECFDETKVPAEGVAPVERQKRLWDRRLEAAPHVELEIPKAVPAGSLPEGYEGEEQQWAAIYAKMTALRDHFRARVTAEQDLRGLEAATEKLVVREGDQVRARPDASPAAILEASQQLRRLGEGGHCTTDDQPARLARLRRDIETLEAGLTGHKERIVQLLGKPDPKGALDELAKWERALEKPDALELTRQAVTQWVRATSGQMDAGEFEGAVEALKAIQSHPHIQRHGQDASVAKALADVAKMLPYCEGQVALAKGTAGFDEALARFQHVGAYRDAERISSQLGAFRDASKLKDTQPFAAWGRFAELAKAQELSQRLRDAAGRAADEVKGSLLADAAGAAKAFNAALVGGGWQKLVDAAAIRDEQLQRLEAFLAQVDGFQIEEKDAKPEGEVVAETREVRLKTTRLLRFAYKLPGAATLPMTVEQTIEWTLRYVPPREGRARGWLIEAWEETY